MSFLLPNCQNNNPNENKTKKEVTGPKVTITKSNFGTTPEGQPVEKYTLKNKRGMEVEVITYGGIITRWTAPNKNGKYENIVLGFDHLDQYFKSNPYFGAIIGRYGNRIAKGQFSLEEQTYQLAINNSPNHLHGGLKGFDKVVWTGKESTTDSAASLKLTYTSKDGEDGYPGELKSTVIYTLTENDALEVTYEATTDKKTIINLTQHSYFNLSGDFSKNILDHVVTINADAYLPVDNTLIPTGEIRAVAGTPFDFSNPKTVGEQIETQNDQLIKGKGYDHCWVLNNQGTFRKIATTYHPATGRFLEISSNEPGLQFYSGNFLDGTLPAIGGGTYGVRSGLCMETQHFPDSPNQKDFPSVVLVPGDKYESKTTFAFSVK